MEQVQRRYKDRGFLVVAVNLDHDRKEADHFLSAFVHDFAGDQYFQIDPTSQFADDDVFTVGAAVQSLSNAFDQFWNCDIAVPASRLPPIRPERPHGPPATFSNQLRARVESGEPLNGVIQGKQPLTWATAQVLYDSPDKRKIEKSQQRGRLMSESV